MLGRKMNRGATSTELPFGLILMVLVIAEMVAGLQSTMIVVALSQLYGLYGNPVRITWLLTAPALTATVAAAMFGRAGDLYGRKRVMMLVLMLATCGSALCAFSSSLNIITIGRALEGTSMAILPLAFGVLREAAPDQARLNVGVGVLGGTFSFTIGIGMFLSGLIIDHAPWQTIFRVTGAAALSALLLLIIVLPRDKPITTTARLDYIGGLTLLVPIGAFLAGLNLGRLWGWIDPTALSVIGLSIVGFACWIFYVLRHPSPIMDLRQLRVPRVAIVNAALATTAMGPMIYPYVFLPILQQPVWTGIGFGVSATLAGVFKLPTNVTSGCASLVAGYLAAKFTFRPVVIAAAAINLLAWLLLWVEHESLWVVVGTAVLLMAPASTIINACGPALIMDVTAPERTSEAMALSSVLRGLAMAVGSQLIAFALATSSIRNAAGTVYPDEQAYMAVFMMMAALAVTALVFAMLIPRVSNREGGSFTRPAAALGQNDGAPTNG